MDPLMNFKFEPLKKTASIKIVKKLVTFVGFPKEN